MRICGLDECGRGPLAGPIVAAAVVFNSKLKGQNSKLKLKDSKLLSRRQQRQLYKKILQVAETVKIEVISTRKINNRGIGWANKEIFRKLIKQIEAQEYIVDGNLKIKVRGKSNLIRSVIKADNKYPEVMAASIVAKVTRDKLMRELAKEYPQFGWNSNVGYGTRYHLAALAESGPCKHHRSVFVTTALRNKSTV